VAGPSGGSIPAIRRRVRVHGRVQGVFFRDSTRERAREAGVQGWVRNLRDGSVEAVFEGEPREVSRLVDFCRAGPRLAAVERVEVFEEEPEGLRGFQIAASAEPGPR
jgi:acylphosphatase